jgi:hypothetical protein
LQLLLAVIMSVTVLVTVTSPNSNRAPLECSLEALPHQPRGTVEAQWFRFCATNPKVTGSIPDGVMEFIIDINPSDRTMALESTQPLTEMSARSISRG